MTFSDKDIERLKSLVRERQSEKRFSHTLGVMNTALILADYYIKDKRDIAAVAALLHDVSKEIPTEEQLRLLSEAGFPLTKEDRESEGVLHSYTAPIIIKRDFSFYASPEVLSAALKHTVGDEDMSILDEIIFLADFIEEGRAYGTSRELRESVLEELSKCEVTADPAILHRACIREIDSTLEYLKQKGKGINPKILLTRNDLLSKI